MNLSTHCHSLIIISLLLLASCSTNSNTANNANQVTKKAEVVDTKNEIHNETQKNDSSKTLDHISKIQMNGSSMYPTVKDSEIMNFEANLSGLTYGSLVFIETRGEKHIKRIIGMSGDTIRFTDGRVFLKKNGNTEFSELVEPYLSGSNINNTQFQSYTGDTFIIPENMFWVMGDNRQNSSDSRDCFMVCSGNDTKEHFLDRSQILGIILQ